MTASDVDYGRELLNVYATMTPGQKRQLADQVSKGDPLARLVTRMMRAAKDAPPRA